MNYQQKYFKYKTKYLNLKNSKNSDNYEYRHSNISESQIARSIGRNTYSKSFKMPKISSSEQYGNVDLADLKQVDKKEDDYRTMRRMMSRDLNRSAIKTDNKKDSISWIEKEIEDSLGATDMLYNGSKSYKKGNIFEKIYNYWLKHGKEFFSNSVRFDARNSHPDREESIKRKKGSGEIVFETNNGEKYIVKFMDLARYEKKEGDNILTWVWALDPDLTKSDPWDKVLKEIKKYPELKDIGLLDPGVKARNYDGMVKWFYIYILSYFLKGVGHFFIIVDDNPDVTLYMIATNVRKLRKK